MTISKAQIFNIALNILGVSIPIENTNISDNRAILLNNYYSLARDYVLKDYDWNFASTFKELSLCENNTLITKYKYAYNYPNDCICARDIFNNTSYIIEEFSINAASDSSKIILTDVENAILRYTKRIEKEIYFSSEFTMALSYYLASLTSNVIVGSIQKGESAYQKYTQILKHAKIINAQEGAENLINNQTYIESRG